MQLLRRIVAVFIFSTILPSGLFSQVIDTAKAFDNLRYRLSKDKKVTIAYLGGSITQGQGASNRAVTSWRPLTTTWFKQNYSLATVTEIDASWVLPDLILGHSAVPEMSAPKGRILCLLNLQ